MAKFEIHLGSTNRETVEADYYRDSADGKFIDFIRDLAGGKEAQVMRVASAHVQKIKRIDG